MKWLPGFLQAPVRRHRMKWPIELTIIRHGQSAYNILKAQKARDPEYQRFLKLFNVNPQGFETKGLARFLCEKYRLGVGDYNTPLTPEGEGQALITGKLLSSLIGLPDLILFSPYLRTRHTLEKLSEGWPELNNTKWVEDDRIREQEHGLSLLYNDWRFFHVDHPEQARLHQLQGRYWYQFPQGESVSMVRDRVRSLVGTLVREHHGKRVLLVTHHLTILSIRATLERLTPEEFLYLDEREKPVNCGVTIYRGNPHEGGRGHLQLKQYNQKIY